jgi:adenylosuccinate lyase
MIARYTLPAMGAIWSDQGRYGRWLKVEIEVCREWARQGRIPRQAFRIIEKKAGFSVKRVEFHEKKLQHDVIAFLASVREKVGPAARFIHMGLTSYDVVDTALAMAMRDASLLISDAHAQYSKKLKVLALRHAATVVAGRSHGVHAEPTSLGLKFLLHHAEAERNGIRLERARETVSYGKISGAVGNYAHVPPALERRVLRRLGLSAAPVSTQILQRDRHAEYLCVLAVVAGSLEKMALEVRNQQRTEIGELEEPFGKGQRGSSAMPHKRNPVLCERVCGLARIVRGYAHAGLENMALWHERDLTNSSAERVAIPDAAMTVDYMLCLMNRVLDGLTVNAKRMRENLDKSGGLIYSQRVMLALVKAGMTREKAYTTVQGHAMKAFSEGKSFRGLLEGDPAVNRLMSPDDIGTCFDPYYYLRHVPELYRRFGLKVRLPRSG